MVFFANEGKSIEIEVSAEIYLRHAIRTRFISINDSYIDIMREYVTGIYQEEDIISISEKIISICQNRTIKRVDVLDVAGRGEQVYALMEVKNWDEDTADDMPSEVFYQVLSCRSDPMQI